ncbi:deoxyguanosinetriphosphate triphosphohydrolase family protein [Rathayibacter iranicus]|uniref:HD domain-containing protein n=2 Tax=Rathayibacter iranicus TaxID=59737 RepID=A0AAD1ENC4_9MICO|nr:dNTP triphosphohydrolase [Rathayibacter iranicus]AZZ57028.1 HD domain-containing protein [Rathayibacter iranicus]MWV29642.1 dNTP triphosphohydrolase [Rathayibacter iranicus NCPPB 2253 = VKM Ac-1602]PPI41952.1 phosphodiesterase [Rathayibacter iranicus]PPI57694.1 phosphodiesterase [Rathayibacter iranicus]PPI68671.1 phosphodiesterase [Rathayibacter iranicus]
MDELASLGAEALAGARSGSPEALGLPSAIRRHDYRRDRRIPEPVDRFATGEEYPEYRVDLERIRFSPYFARLSAVTQVISPSGVGQVVHNRLTHSIKVTAVARAIAMQLTTTDPAQRELVERLGGCDPVVVQAAASAHDLGHPPFGHLGEQALDRLARDRLGLVEGFEGNAQSFRILSELDVCETVEAGLNLTAASRAAVLKYPWGRTVCRPAIDSADPTELPRGSTASRWETAPPKFSAYTLDLDDMLDARSGFAVIAPWQQTLECSVMDVADDIAYSLHDLDDFYRAGVLQQAAVAVEFRAFLREQNALAALDAAELWARAPGHSLEMLRRRMVARDPWIASDEHFRASVERVSTELVEGLLAVPFDGSTRTERAIEAFVSSWIGRLQRSVVVLAEPNVRSGHLSLLPDAWHDVTVLKFVHTRFVIDRPDFATYQRGQSQVLETLVTHLDAWLADPRDGSRAPQKLLDLIELATDGYFRLRADHPDWLPTADRGRPTSDPAVLHRLGRGRGVVDYVATLTDEQAMALAARLRGDREPWAMGT